MANEQGHRWLDVAAGLVLDADGCLLLGQRPEGKSYAGWWELPGGKLEPGETPMQALHRELHEELGIEVTEATPWVTYVHEYPHATVRLAFCRVTGWRGEPRGLENQALRWVDPGQPLEALEAGLGGGHLLPATLPPVRWLQLPDRYLILPLTSPADVPGHLDRIEHALAAGVRLLQFRAPEWQGGASDGALLDILRRTLALTKAAGARLLVNSAHPESWWREADGVQLRAADLDRVDSRPDVGLLGASCHSRGDLARARQLSADFALIGPVLPTATHPGHPGLGWEAFAELNQEAGMPVLAIGGQSPATLAIARQHGAHGIAGIRHLLD
ncbi:MAG: Nudix family hydrolase [Pigmentiphaga sp.]|nr:Nudix family hydrolase [Pigmentiphaga sp.]